MIKTSIAFLAGTVFSTGIVICGGGRPAAMLALGFMLTVSIAAGVLWLTGVRRLARFLNAFADGLALSGEPASRQAGSVRHSRVPRVADQSGYRKPSTKQRDQILDDTLDEYLPDGIFAHQKTTDAGRVQ
jgi:uncharacterized membrane protein YdfJ with MMPL/SSD domain